MILDLQFKNGIYQPFSREAKEKSRDFIDNQIFKANITAVRKPHSVRQMRMFWACCRCVADNTEDENWNTEEKVCTQIKLALKFFKGAVVTPEGNVHFMLDSISFENLPQINRSKFFDRSWPIMAKKIGITKDELLSNAEREYQ